MNPETKKVMKLKRCSVRLNPNFENFVIEGLLYLYILVGKYY